MTLVKDDKSSKTSKKTIKKSTASKPKPMKTNKSEDVTESVETMSEVEMCGAEAEANVEDKKVSVEDKDAEDVEDVEEGGDGAGPSSGVRLSEQQREENLWQLHKLQRRLLLAGHGDGEDTDTEMDADTDGFSRSA